MQTPRGLQYSHLYFSLRTNSGEKEVLELIDTLQTKNSLGPDGIHPRVLKEVKYEIANLLNKICNMSLRSASVLEEGQALLN